MLSRKAYPKEELLIHFKTFWSVLTSAGDAGDPARGVFPCVPVCISWFVKLEGRTRRLWVKAVLGALVCATS